MATNESNHERVGRALDHLKSGLRRFVEDEFRTAFQDRALERARQYPGERLPEGPFSSWDVAALLRLMEDAWNDVFRRKLGRAERSLVVELRQVRNQWAHQQDFSRKDAYRAIDSMQRLLTAVAAPEADDLEGLLRFGDDPPAASNEVRPSEIDSDEPITVVETVSKSPLLSEAEFAETRKRALELDGIIARGQRIGRFWLFVWAAGVVGIVFAGRTLALQHVSLWLVIPGGVVAGIVALVVALALAFASSKGSLGSIQEANKELVELATRMKLHNEELERQVEEELPVLPPLPPVESQIEDPFMAMIVGASGANATLAVFMRAAIREKMYPGLLRQALTWWQQDRPNIDAYVRAHRDEILANAKEIEQEFASDMNFTVDMDGCRRLALWALRHAGEEVRYYLPEMHVAPEKVGLGSPEVMQLARIIRTWGGHKHELLLPRARAMGSTSAIGAGEADREGIREKLEHAAERAIVAGQSNHDVMATLRGILELELEHRRASGVSPAELERTRAEGVRFIEEAMKARRPEGTSGRT